MNEFDASSGGRGSLPSDLSPIVDSIGEQRPDAISALRPMSLGEILDRAVQMLKLRFVLFAGIAAFPAMATLLHSIVSEQTFQRGVSDSLVWKIAGPLLTFVFWLATVILTPLAAAAQCRAASQVVLERPVTIGSAYGAFSGRRMRLIGLGIWQGLLSLWPMIPAMILVIALSAPMRGPSANGWIVVGAVLALIPCAPLYARYLLAFPATAITDSDVYGSIRRSVELGRGYRWKILLAFLLPLAIGLILGVGGVSLLTWIGSSMNLSALHPFLFTVLEGLWTFAASLLYEPLTSIAITLTYYDLCVRKEGFDIVQMMEQAGMASAPAETEPA